MSIYFHEIDQMFDKLSHKFFFENVENKILGMQNILFVDYLLLRSIREIENVTLTKLSKESDYNYDILRNKLEKLILKGYVKKISSLEDKRKKVFILTEEGKNEYFKINKVLNKKLKFLISDFTVNEEKAVLKFLSRINQLTFE